VHLVAGFGRIIDLTPEQVLTDLAGADALLAAEQNAIDHMNADHRDALNLYATKLLGAEAADWRCTGCDPDGLDISADEHGALRLDFSRRIVTPAELRHVLKDLAEQARAATP
jgi:putative heme iron utilization protein